MPNDSVLRILLELEAQGVVLGAGHSSAALKALEAQAKRTEAELQRLKRAAGQLQQVSQGLALAGAAIAGPFLAAAKAYVDSTGKAEGASRRWLAATDRIHESYIGVGRVAATAMLPALERAAGLAERAAKFAEANPQAVQAALGLGGGLIALGALGSLAAKGIQVYADVKLLGAAALQDQAANKMLAAAQLQAGAGAGGAGAAGAAGAAAKTGGGLAGLAALLAANIGAATPYVGPGGLPDQMRDDMLRRTGQAPYRQGAPITDLAAWDRELLNASNGLRTFVDKLFGMTSAITPEPHPAALLGSTASTFSPRLQGLGNFEAIAADKARRAAALPLYQNYQEQKSAGATAYGENVAATMRDYTRQLTANEESYQQTRLRAVHDFQENEADLEKGYNSNRLRQLRDFQQSEQNAQSDFTASRARQLRDFAESEQDGERAYYDDRLKRARDYGIETERDEQDHQRNLQALSEDHAGRADELARSGDALGFVKEQRAYERQRKEAEDNYQVQAKRRNADYALELKDAEKAFGEQRADRLAAFEQGQADQAEDFEQARRERLANFEQAQTDAKADFEDQQRARADEQRQRLTDMADEFRDQQTELARQETARLTQMGLDFKAENTARDDAFEKQLTALDAHLTGQYDMQVKAQALSSIEFGKWLDALKDQAGGSGGLYCPPGYHYDAKSKSCVADPPGPGNHAAGGYVGRGLAMLGEQGREFVLSNPTMSAAERLTGAPLTQERILTALARNNSYAVHLGGIAVNGAGGHGAALAQTLELVRSEITEAWVQFGNMLETSP